MKTAVVTGVSSGIGLVVARELARDGWRVIAQGRNPARAEAALAEIRAAAPQAQVDMLLADLAVMDNVDEFATKIGALTDRIDLLVNNAGATPSQRIEAPGRAYAPEIAGRGARVVANGIAGSAADENASAIRATGGDALARLRTHCGSQKMMVAAMQMADMKVCAHRS